MTISPDQIVLWDFGWGHVNATIAFSVGVTVLLVGASILATRNLSTGPEFSRWQNLLEIVVGAIRDQIEEVGQRNPTPYIPFVGTLFLYIAICSVLGVVPGFVPPTASLSTTTALAICVFVAVPGYAVVSHGPLDFLKHYAEPSVWMIPFNVIGELSRTLALAVRLFGNMMSGTVVVGIIVGIIPLFFPVVLQALGLLTGLIQAYIFSILAMVYIASASSAHASTVAQSVERARHG